MKRKLIALVCAVTLVMGMSISASAAGSNNSSNAAQEATTSSSDSSSGSSSSSSDSSSGSTDAAAAEQAEVVTVPNATGQTITGATLAEFARTTTVSGVEGASVTAVSNATAKALIAEANNTCGSNVFIATVVDLHGGAGTYTLGCPNVWAGQSVTIMHQKADGSYEYITPSSVENNSVTFTLTSTSPVAILINTTTAPKTGDIVMMIIVLAAVCACGMVMFGKKAKA